MPETGPDQALVGYRSNEEWQDLLAQTASMIGTLEDIADEEVRAQVFGALAGIDAVHREAIHRLVRLFKEGVLEQVVTDPAIRSLMGMYDLLPPETPGCQKIWDFLDEDAVPDLGTRGKGIGASPMADPPHWSPLPDAAVAEEGSAYLCEMDEGPLLVLRVDKADYALSAVCPTHRATIEGGSRDGFTWHCPHGLGCSYDIRNGNRLGGGPGLKGHNVRIEPGGRRMIGFGMPFEPKLPAF